MKWFKSIYSLLSSLSFALFLIAAAVLLVIAGTLLEARTDSHLLAAQWTYHHPIFSVLLGCFFINILCSALRRWPFKLHHIPFLMTHLGLLMILTGTIWKNHFGIQGHLYLLEGSGSSRLMLPHTLALHIEKRGIPNHLLYDQLPLTLGEPLKVQSQQFPELTIRVLRYTPHAKAYFESWMKGQYGWIAGLPPIPMQSWSKDQPLSIACQMHPYPQLNVRWDAAALLTDDIEQALQTAYENQTELIVTVKENPLVSQRFFLNEALQGTVPCLGGTLKTTCRLPCSLVDGLVNPHLELEWTCGQEREYVILPLAGTNALMPQLQSRLGPSKSRFDFDLKRPPLIVLINDSHQECHVAAFDPYGRLDIQTFSPHQWDSLIVYDQGFGGYAIPCHIPFPAYPSSRQDKMLAEQAQLAKQLEQVVDQHTTLAPPVQLFKETCDQAQLPFASLFVEFLALWSRQPHVLMHPSSSASPDLQTVLQKLAWDQIPSVKQGCQWINLLFGQLEDSLRTGSSIKNILKTHRWPLMTHLQTDEEDERHLLQQLAQQLLGLSSHLPPVPERTSLSSEQLFSAYLQAYGLDYHTLLPEQPAEKESFALLQAYHAGRSLDPSLLKSDAIHLETPLSYRHTAALPPKLEDQRPCLLIEVKKGSAKEMVSLTYDPLAAGLKWPVFGEYLLRLQPQWVELPYHVRLRQAKQLNYAESNQPYSYESDVWIQEMDQSPVEASLSMNHVYETWDGFRFYLAGMSSSREGIKQVQLVVNQDPVKYLLTYPGGSLVALGAILLFWLRPYRRK